MPKKPKPPNPNKPPHPVEPPPVEPTEPPPTHPVEPPIEPHPPEPVDPHPPEPEIEPPTEIVEPPEVIEPPVEPPVEAEGVPAFDPDIHEMILEDDLSRYESVEKMGEAQDRDNPSLPYPMPRIIPYQSPYMISQPVNKADTDLLTDPDGSKFMRIFYTGVAQNGPSFNVYGGKEKNDLATHYARYLARVTYPGDIGNLTIAIKWFLMWHHKLTATGGATRVQHNTHGAWPIPPEWKVPAKSPWQMYDGGDISEGNGMQPVGPYLNDLVNTGWFECIHAHRAHSAEGVYDGLSQMFVNQQKILDVRLAMVGVTPPGGTKPWCTQADVELIDVNNGIGHPTDRQLEWGGVHTDQQLKPWTYDVKGVQWWATKEPA